MCIVLKIYKIKISLFVSILGDSKNYKTIFLNDVAKKT